MKTIKLLSPVHNHVYTCAEWEKTEFPQFKVLGVINGSGFDKGKDFSNRRKYTI